MNEWHWDVTEGDALVARAYDNPLHVEVLRSALSLSEDGTYALLLEGMRASRNDPIRSLRAVLRDTQLEVGLPHEAGECQP